MCHFIMNMKIGRLELLNLPAGEVTMVTYLVKVSQVYDNRKKKPELNQRQLPN